MCFVIMATWNPGEVTVRLHRGSLRMSRVWPLRELRANTGRPCESTPYSTTEPSGKPAAAFAAPVVDSTPVLCWAGKNLAGFAAEAHGVLPHGWRMSANMSRSIIITARTA